MANPPKSVLKWAAAAHGEDATVASVVGLHDGGSPWRLQVVTPDATTEAIVRTSFDPPRWRDGPGARHMLACGAAALKVAQQHGLAAPRLIACDLHGLEAGRRASLETVLPGNSGWPELPSAAGWRDAGAAIARVHRVALQPQDFLPLHFYHHPEEDLFPHLARDPSTPLLQLASEVVLRYERPHGESVLLHGDLWPGNVLWIGDRCVGLIDWKEARVGDPGIDLGHLRFQAAMLQGPGAAVLVREGWEDEIGRKATDVAYWDAVVALDFRGPEAPDRHAAFLQAAIDQLV